MFEYAAVIPAHNEVACVAGAIESVLAQSLPAAELIVVDDGSTDGTGQRAREFPSVRVVTHPRCQGLSQARNTGVAAASAGWVALLDADDRWYPEKIQQQAQLAERTGAGLIYCGARLRGHGLKSPVNVPATAFPDHRSLRRKLLLTNCITGSGSAVLARRDLLARAGGFDTSLRTAEDYDLWIRLSELTTFAAVRRPLVTLWKRPGRLGADPDAMFQAGRVLLDKHACRFRAYRDGFLLRRRAEAGLYERRGIAHLSNGNHGQARRDFARAAALWPFRVNSLVPLLKLCTGIHNPTPGSNR